MFKFAYHLIQKKKNNYAKIMFENMLRNIKMLLKVIMIKCQLDFGIVQKIMYPLLAFCLVKIKFFIFSRMENNYIYL